jgi:hypothetical protein
VSLLRDALPFLASLLDLGWILVLRLGAPYRSHPPMVLLHPSEYIAAPALAEQLPRMELANRAADIEHDAASCRLKPDCLGL